MDKKISKKKLRREKALKEKEAIRIELRSNMKSTKENALKLKKKLERKAGRTTENISVQKNEGKGIVHVKKFSDFVDELENEHQKKVLENELEGKHGGLRTRIRLLKPKFFQTESSTALALPAPEKKKLIPKWLKVLVAFSVSGVCLVILAVGGIYYVYGKDLPDVRNLKEMKLAETTTIYDREGNILYKIYGEENREFLPLNQIDRDIVNATIAIEDKAFYKHFGFDPIGMTRAFFRNLEDDKLSQGASTITQQLAKNIYLTREKTFDRKIKELILALQIEWNFSKDEILELYLNKIPYGSNSFGVEAAAQTFFGKSARELSLVEAAVLASLPKAPSTYSPYGPNRNELMGYCGVKIAEESVKNIEAELNSEIEMRKIETEVESVPLVNPTAEELKANEEIKLAQTVVCDSPYDPDYTWGRKDLVLQRMLEDGSITKDEFLKAFEEGKKLKFRDLKHEIKEEHFVFYVRDYLEKKYGKELVESGGLDVVTTLDPKIQKLGKEAIDAYADVNLKRYGANNGAMVALDTKTGQILAMVGSKNYYNESIQGQVNVTTSYRQPGSAFKPLIFAAAIENGGIGSGTYLNDYKTAFNNSKKIPNNYDGKFLGKMTIRMGLGGSRNIPAIKAFYVGGDEEKILDFLDKIGFTNLKQFKEVYNKQIQENPAVKTKWTFNYGWPLAIGSGEIRLLDLTNAYATLGNNGVMNPPNPIMEIRDRNGNVIEKFEPGRDSVQVMDPQTAFIVTDILADPYARPAGLWRNILTIPGHMVAAKTGTSDKKVGARSLPNNTLTVGYSKQIASGFWFGNTDGKTMFNSAYSLYTTDPPWNKFMKEVLKDVPREDFVAPDNIIKQGKEYFPSFWNKKDYDKEFKRLDAGTRDCNAEQRKADPVGCKPEVKKGENPAAGGDGSEQAARSTPVSAPEKPIGSAKPE